MQDKELWSWYKSGEISGLEGLYNAYYMPLANYGFKFTEDKSLIDESIQDLFQRLWRNRDATGTPPAVKQYLLLSFRQILLRKLQYSPSRLEETFSEEHVPFYLELSYEHPLIRAERAADLKKKVDALTDALTHRQREAIFLKYYEDLSFEEIAAILQINANGTYKLVYRALERLREHFVDFSLLVLLYLLQRR
ncbi:sigma-70 family RNA polymerase sigma factor [Chitinophaga varians]|uniref:Sigma-70 family RNA polymerase sigma factor n=1 Tax=Chitinophaga varians TaxID=2202339 RepID=A0A847RNT1_9BACT|nr:sigma-70 family RNA polymerase sigma factor [Chitinophaga varians]NLR67400.1 sigma-70 family RNA polymerase sigma factor [Chitinophaga varians]